MDEYFLKDQYFNWLCEQFNNTKYAEGYSYVKLLSYLHSLKFDYLIEKDGNREEDGIDLRYRFGVYNGYPQSMIASFLDNKPCSVLEMMCALAIRCEESIMTNPDFDRGPDKWFWVMIKNLGLKGSDDYCFDEQKVEFIINRFLNREYEYNGNGGLFILRNPPRDLRNVEIWNQMCWYLDEYLNM